MVAFSYLLFYLKIMFIPVFRSRLNRPFSSRLTFSLSRVFSQTFLKQCIGFLLGMGLLPSLALATPTDALTIDLDQHHPFRLNIKKLEVHTRKANGSPWDLMFKSKPDLLVQVFINQHLIYLSKVQRDTFKIELNQKTPPFSLEQPQSEIRVVVLDKDLGSKDDLIGVMKIYPTQEDFKNEKTFRIASQRVKEFEFQILKNEKKSVQTTTISNQTSSIQGDPLDPSTPLPLLEAQPIPVPSSLPNPKHPVHPSPDSPPSP